MNAYTLAVLLWCLRLSVPAFAQSQPPSPGARTTRQQPQREPAPVEQQAPADVRGTREAPLVIQVQPAAKTNDEAANEQAQKNEEASEKRWAFVFGVTTAVVGVLQVFAIGFQVYIAKRQNAIIEKQSAIMDGQKAAAEVQSGHMLAGLEEARKSADAAAISAAAARDAVLLAHRPRLNVRAVSAEFPLNTIQGGYARIVNLGTSTATLKGLSSRWIVVDRLPMSNPLDTEASHAISDTILPPGHFVLSELPDLTLGAEDYCHFADETDQWALYLIGVVKYVDEKGYWRRTGFCRRYSRPAKRFEVVNNPDYEYEE